MGPPASAPSAGTPRMPGRPFSERVRARDPRVATLAIVGSAVLHVVLLVFLLPAFAPVGERRLSVPEWMIELVRPIGGERFILLVAPAPRPAEPPTPSPGPLPVELPTLVEAPPALPEPEPGEELAPSGFAGAEEPAPETLLEAEPSGAGAAPTGAGIAIPATLADRLRPGEKDPRLWFLPPEELVELSPEQLLQLELALAIAALGDSAAAIAEAQRRGTDWTFMDSRGRRWGISPGQIHLGDITIPLPFGFVPPPNTLAARRAREDAEIANQAARQEVNQALRGRAAEIRRRRDAERARAPGDTLLVNGR